MKIRARKNGNWVYSETAKVDETAKQLLLLVNDNWIECEYDTLGECSCFTDTNGVEIFEGDVLKITDSWGGGELAEVVFVGGFELRDAVSVIHENDGRYRNYLNVKTITAEGVAKAYKVIGSVYDRKAYEALKADVEEYAKLRKKPIIFSKDVAGVPSCAERISKSAECRFTGLKDKNGVNIYEGSRVHFLIDHEHYDTDFTESPTEVEDAIGIVMWNDAEAEFYIKFISEKPWFGSPDGNEGFYGVTAGGVSDGFEIILDEEPYPFDLFMASHSEVVKSDNRSFDNYVSYESDFAKFHKAHESRNYFEEGTTEKAEHDRLQKVYFEKWHIWQES